MPDRRIRPSPLSRFGIRVDNSNVNSRGEITKRERRMLATRGNQGGEEYCGPAVDGGTRGLPPSTLRHLSKAVGQGTLASAGRVLRQMPWGETPWRERVAGLALAQMWAQARLMGAVMGGNQLVTAYLYAGCEARPG
jgi:hypothetical protein